jgi:hypothetical protein
VVVTQSLLAHKSRGWVGDLKKKKLIYSVICNFIHQEAHAPWVYEPKRTWLNQDLSDVDHTTISDQELDESVLRALMLNIRETLPETLDKYYAADSDSKIIYNFLEHNTNSDATWYKTATGQMMLTLTAADANNNQLNLAYAIVDCENKVNWSWFFTKARADFPGIKTNCSDQVCVWTIGNCSQNSTVILKTRTCFDRIRIIIIILGLCYMSTQKQVY